MKGGFMSVQEVALSVQTKTAAAGEVEKLAVARILCPVDFSEFSRGALRYAITLARHFGAELYLQHTAEMPESVLIASSEPGVVQEWRHNIPDIEQGIRRMMERNGIQASEAKIVVQEGAVLDSVLQMIFDQRIDLVVMGTHGHKGFSHLVLGSFAEAITHQSACPVLVVSRPEKDFVRAGEPDTVRMKTILLATDFSTHSDRALAFALQWASEWGAKLIVFHAVPTIPAGTGGMIDLFPEYNPYFEKQIASGWEKIRHLVPGGAQQQFEAGYEVRHGDPRTEILTVAEQRGADLIILGARGSGTSVAPWGSVSSAVVRAGRLPVLVVRDMGA